MTKRTRTVKSEPLSALDAFAAKLKVDLAPPKAAPKARSRDGEHPLHKADGERYTWNGKLKHRFSVIVEAPVEGLAPEDVFAGLESCGFAPMIAVQGGLDWKAAKAAVIALRAKRVEASIVSPTLPKELWDEE